MRKVRNDAGYTITELLVVLVILGLIAAAASPQILGDWTSSKVKAARLQLDVVLSALDAFNVDVGRYPSEREGIEFLLIQPEGTAGWSGPYLRSRRNLMDPWGAPARYKMDERGQASVMTFGADGKEGGKDTNSDLRAPDV